MAAGRFQSFAVSASKVLVSRVRILVVWLAPRDQPITSEFRLNAPRRVEQLELKASSQPKLSVEAFATC